MKLNQSLLACSLLLFYPFGYANSSGIEINEVIVSENTFQIKGGGFGQGPDVRLYDRFEVFSQSDSQEALVPHPETGGWFRMSANAKPPHG